MWKLGSEWKFFNLLLISKMFKFDLPLVNVHTHAAMIGFRGLAEDLPLKDWLEKIIWPMEAKYVRPDFVYKNTKLAIEEMKKNGIRLVNNMYFFEDEVAKLAEELKFNVVLGEAILDFPTPSFQTPEDIIKKTEDLILKYKDNKYVKVAVSPHSIYTVCKDNLIKSKQLSDKYSTLLHIHIAETKQEFDESMNNNGCSPVKYLYNLGILNSRSILAHAVWLTDEDIEILQETKSHVVHCPLSNLKLGSGVAPVAKLLAKGVNVCLGTDGAASSNRLDIWEVGKIAGLLQKGITGDTSVLNTKEIIKMMTVNGMKALGYTELDGKSIDEIENIIDMEDNYNYLYELNVNEIF